MDSYTGHKAIFFNPALAITPPIVNVFTELRQGEYYLNAYGYVELTCQILLCDVKLTGDTASKLTAALSIHMDSFLGLSCNEHEGESRADYVTFTARFSKYETPESVDEEICLKAADIIDTLMAMMD